jgi:hypothetical protein
MMLLADLAYDAFKAIILHKSMQFYWSVTRVNLYR